MLVYPCVWVLITSEKLDHKNVNLLIFQIFGVLPDLRMANQIVDEFFLGGFVMERRWDTSVYRMPVYIVVRV